MKIRVVNGEILFFCFDAIIIRNDLFRIFKVGAEQFRNFEIK